MAAWLLGLGQQQAIASLCLPQHKKKISFATVHWIFHFPGQRNLMIHVDHVIHFPKIVNCNCNCFCLILQHLNM